ncbi:hypothetical protein Tco_0079447 [Tanacetum coccineum]
MRLPSKLHPVCESLDIWGIDLWARSRLPRGKSLFSWQSAIVKMVEAKAIPTNDARRSLQFLKSASSPDLEVDIIKKTENQAKMTKLSMDEMTVPNIRCNLNPSDGPGKPNSIIMKTVKTKWALNQFQQPICVQLTKTVKTLKAQS